MSEKEVMKMTKAEKIIYTFWISLFVIFFLMLMTLTSKGGWIMMLMSIFLVLPYQKITFYQKYGFLKLIRYRVVFATLLAFLGVAMFQLTTFKVNIDPAYNETEKNQAEIKIAIVHGKESVVKIGDKVVTKISDGLFVYKSKLKEGENKFIFNVASTNTDDQKVVEEVQSTIFYLTKKLKIERKREEKLEDLKYKEELALKNCKENPEKALIVKKSSWKTANYDTMYEHTVLLYNPCNIELKDFRFKIKYFGSSGSEIDSLTTDIVYKSIKPKSKKWIKVKGGLAITSDGEQYQTSSVNVYSAKIKK